MSENPYLIEKQRERNVIREFLCTTNEFSGKFIKKLSDDNKDIIRNAMEKAKEEGFRISGGHVQQYSKTGAPYFNSSRLVQYLEMIEKEIESIKEIEKLEITKEYIKAYNDFYEVYDRFNKAMEEQGIRNWRKFVPSSVSNTKRVNV